MAKTKTETLKNASQPDREKRVRELSDISCELLNITEAIRELTKFADVDAVLLVDSLERASSIFSAYLWKEKEKVVR